MNKSKSNHYTYLITELSTNMKYIGVRSCNGDPINDLGIKYFSSSSNKDFIKNQKENKNNYKYEVLSIYKSRKDAIIEEARLHELYNVKFNSTFYNAYNSSKGFDATGMIYVKDIHGNTEYVKTDDPRYLSGELVHHTKGMHTVMLQI